MLYGNLIFIKKTGGDGSKYPVTEKNIKIGRSENCLIRIYNPQVAPEHCQLIIDCNGQAKLRNLFTPIILNGKPLDQGDVTLCHGDVFKLGERLARWEYLPTSKYFQQQISPTGRLIAVVNPQRRSVELPGTSASQILVSNNTPVGSKRKFSDKFGAESFSMAKHRKTVGPDTSVKPKIDLGKHQIRRHSIKSGKMLLKIPTIKSRKSMPGIISSRTLQGKISEKSRKSTLPSWKVSDDAQPEQSTQGKRSPFGGGAVKTPLKRSLKNEVRTPSKSTPIKVKTPKRLRLDSKSGDKTQLNTIMESPPKLESARSSRSLGKSPVKVIPTPQRKQSVQAVRLVQSEKKPRSGHGVSKPNRGFRKMSLVLNRVDGNRIIRLSQKINIPGRKSAKGKVFSNKDDVEVGMSSSRNLAGSRKSSAKKTSEKGDPSLDSPNQTRRESLKSASLKTLRKSNKPINQSPVEKVAKDVAQTPPLIYFSDDSDSVNIKRTSRVSVTSGQKSHAKSVRKSSAHPVDTFQTPQKFSKKAATSSLKKTREEGTISSVSTPSRSRGSGSIGSTKVVSSSKGKASPRGVRRKLNLSVSSAERAAKKLKTSSPKKPDKNKRAALLVLGKANRKQQLSQNVKVLLKQKIVKKAIKQSVALPLRKVEEKKTTAKKIKKVLQKKKKKPLKINHTANISTPARVSLAAKEPPASNKSTEKSINVLESSTPSVKRGRERSSLSRSKINSPVPLAKIATPNSGSVKSPAKSGKRTETTESTNQTISPFVKFDKSSESYIFSSNRRCSKRLSSKNDIERPDFVELSPTALGLIPKNIEVFKTPKEKKRKSSSLVTPRNIRTTGIIKAASTSKIGNRKSVSFSSKDLTTNAFTPNINENTDFDFDSFHTSNITADVFVSPLDKSGATPVVDFVTDENMKPSEKRSSPGSKKVVRKLLLSPQKETVNKRSKLSDQTNTSRNNMSNSKSIRKPGVSPRGRKSPRNDLTDVRGVRRLLATPKLVKSPKNDLTDVRGVKNLFETRKVQRSPKNDLSDVRGVKKLMQTPKVHKSPKNDLSDLKGVKKLMRTPKQQKSPKNELTDLRGVKRLLQSPRNQKSPKNDLTDVTGVKRLFTTPKVQKSPKNDLTNVTGVKRLLKTPKVQKSPKNSLTDLEGVQELFISPEPPKNRTASSRPGRAVNKINKGPKNDLSDVYGVRELFARHNKSVSDHNVSLTGVAELLDMSAPEEVVVEKGGSEPKRKKSLDERETKTLRGRPRRLGSENMPQVGTPKLGAKIEGSTEVKTRSTRSRKQDPNSTAGEETNKPPETGGRRTTRAKKAETVKKLTRAKVESRIEKKASKAESPKTQRKRKPVDAVDSSPPKLRRKAAAVTSEKSVSKVNSIDSETSGIASKTKTTKKAKEKVEAKSLKKVAGKLKTATKKISKVQSKTTKSGTTSVSKTRKVQKRSQAGSKLESSKSGSDISPRKTRSVSTKSSSQKARSTAAGRKK